MSSLAFQTPAVAGVVHDEVAERGEEERPKAAVVAAGGLEVVVLEEPW